ncbi:cell division topological specificity factor MinE [Enterobacteriaceae endosymbiont of Macroplea appendiculata]|uniref:cell division topological specificity factor MinE n=1 Tax=Enterobacteriaceae endosymbiont of Macroplea appendiculata TaxID=2675790 RepID=UPI0014499672|nr:cell division topological specificity factor MinE [Enterobacteriaceae endosymbiont of Macroplea appendiculata]QJC30742.1 cell division topological specificity factor MinE [Enterobacteriaceae endosymbiont of Macroplea appendiculata]
MYFINFFLSRKKTAANIAKQRLKILITANSHVKNIYPIYITQLKQELVDTICKFMKTDPNMINIIYNNKGNTSHLVLNITLPSKKTNKVKKHE